MISKWKLVYYILIDKRFFQELCSVLQYAINNYYEKRGDGASDVLFFESIHYKKITK
jgi:hypothetical protein